MNETSKKFDQKFMLSSLHNAHIVTKVLTVNSYRKCVKF